MIITMVQTMILVYTHKQEKKSMMIIRRAKSFKKYAAKYDSNDDGNGNNCDIDDDFAA